MAAVNIGVVFSQLQKSTLLVDLNFAKPKLMNYFKEHPFSVKTCIYDLLVDYKSMIDGDEKITQDTMHHFDIKGNTTSIPLLDCLPVKSGEAVGNTNLFDWKDFYSTYYGGGIVEYLRNYWSNEYEAVILISEKEMTDAASVATIQMPDILLLLITHDIDNFNNSYRVAMAVRNKNSKYSDRQTIILPILGRVEHAEISLYNEFKERVIDKFSVFMPTGIDPYNYFNEMSIQNIPRAAYNSEIVVLNKSDDRLSLEASYRHVANHLLGIIGKSKIDS